MAKTPKSTIPLIGILLSIIVVAVTPAKAQECDSILRDGIFDLGTMSNDTEAISTAFNWIRHKGYTTVQEAIDGGISFAGIDFGGGRAASTISLYEAENIIKNSTQFRNKFSSSFKTASTPIINAWTECMNNRGGLALALYTTDSPRQFRLILKFNPIGDLVKTTVDEEPTIPQGVTCEPQGVLKKGLVITHNPKRFICTRSTDDAVAIDINTDTGGASVVLKQIPKPPPPPINITLDMNLCSGTRCRDRNLRPGQLVEWKSTLAASRDMGPQLSLPEDVITSVFCKSATKLTDSEFQAAVLAINYEVIGNKNERGYFSLGGDNMLKFKAYPGGKFLFANDANGNHAIEGRLTLTLRRSSDCPPE